MPDPCHGKTQGVFVAALRYQVKNRVSPDEWLAAARIGGVWVKYLTVSLLVEQDEAMGLFPVRWDAAKVIRLASIRELLLGKGHAEVAVEIAAVRRNPLEPPAHAFLESLDLRQRRPRDHDHCDVSCIQVHDRPIDMIHQKRATRTALLPGRSEHEVVDDQLATSVKQFSELHVALRRVECVLLLDLDPGQLTPLPADFVALVSQILLPSQEFDPSLEPLVLRYNPVCFCTLSICLHRQISFRVALLWVINLSPGRRPGEIPRQFQRHTPACSQASCLGDGSSVPAAHAGVNMGLRPADRRASANWPRWFI